MKSFAIALAGTAFVALAGCNQGASVNEMAGNEADANAAATNVVEAGSGNEVVPADNAVDGKPTIDEAADGTYPEKPVANDSAPAEAATGEKPTN